MSIRVTLTSQDIELLVRLVEQAGSSITPYNNKEFMAIQRQHQLLAKLKSQHPRSVETLGAPGTGDSNGVAKKDAN